MQLASSRLVLILALVLSSQFASAAVGYVWEKDSAGQVFCASTDDAGNSKYANYAMCVKNVGVRYAWTQDFDGQTYCAQTTKAGDQIKEASTAMCSGAKPASRVIQGDDPNWEPQSVQNYDDESQSGSQDDDGYDDSGAHTYGWQDQTKTMCVQYKSSGRVAHFVAPGKCKNAD